MSEVVEGVSDERVNDGVKTEPEVRRGRGGNRNPTGKGGFKKGQNKREPKPKPPAGIDVLGDMDKAYSTAETPEDSPMVKAFREKAHAEPEKFLAQYMKLKLAAADAVRGTEVAVEEPGAKEFGSVGPKEVAVEELAEKLLDEWEKEDSEGKL